MGEKQKNNMSITISGGDPLRVSLEGHEYLLARFKALNITCKILINLKSFDLNKDSVDSYAKILNMYDVIGLSINTKEDLAYYNEFKILIKKPVSIVTNFNIHNVFLYDDIEALITKGMAWQVQFTIFEHKHNKDAIYNNDSALKHLSTKVSTSIDKCIEVVIADNANSTPCGAGMQGIGITHNGIVIPCLSMRSWSRAYRSTYSNDFYDLKLHSLKDIWETGFSEYRFKDFECCKDFCNNKVLEVTLKKNDSTQLWHDVIDEMYKQPYYPGTLVYGVSTPNVCTYSVTTPSRYTGSFLLSTTDTVITNSTDQCCTATVKCEDTFKVDKNEE